MKAPAEMEKFKAVTYNEVVLYVGTDEISPFKCLICKGCSYLTAISTTAF